MLRSDIAELRRLPCVARLWALFGQNPLTMSGMSGSIRSMDEPESPSIWTKVDYSLIVEPVAAEADGARRENWERWRQGWRPRRIFLDVFGSLFWLYALLELFVFNVDKDILGSSADYRFFYFAAFAVLLVILFRGAWYLVVIPFAYIFFFPLVILCWKLPRLIYKSGSPVAFLATVNAVTAFVGDLKHTIFTGTVAAFAALIIVASHSRAVLALASAAILVLLALALFRKIKFSLVPTRFLNIQQNAIRTAVNANFTQQLLAPDDNLRRADVQKFTEAQQNIFTQKLANGVIANRLLALWAFQLEKYRRSPVPLFFNILSYLWLLVIFIVAAALLNLALFHADPMAYSFQAEPSFLVIVRYVFAGLYASEIHALQPTSDLANGISVATSFIGLILLGSLLLSSVLSYKATRDESDIRDAIREIRREGDRLDEKIKEEYEVSVTEAIARLEQLKHGLVGIITFLSTRIPKDFEQS